MDTHADASLITVALEPLSSSLDDEIEEAKIFPHRAPLLCVHNQNDFAAVGWGRQRKSYGGGLRL